MKPAQLLFFCLWGMVHCDSGVYFTKQNEIYAAYGSWIITFTIDLQPYQTQFNTLYKEVWEFEQVTQKLTDKSYVQGLPEAIQKQYALLANSTKGMIDAEIHHFYQEYKEVQKVWESVEMLLYNQPMIPTNLVTTIKNKGLRRPRRALFSFVGSLMSSLFGTATTANLRKVTSHE